MTITPMLAASGPLPEDSAKWAYEVKWDGFRALLQASPAGVTITSRNGYDMTSRYPELEGLRHAVSAPVLLDGEIVALDADSRPDFAALWFRSRGSVDPEARLCFMAFDVLQLGGEVLMDRPYRERRGILEELSPRRSPLVHTRDAHTGRCRAVRRDQAHGSRRGRRQASRLSVPTRDPLEGVDQYQALAAAHLRAARLAPS